MTDPKQQYMYEVKALSKHANPALFQANLAQFDSELPGHWINPLAAEAMAMPPNKRRWRNAIIETRESIVGTQHFER